MARFFVGMALVVLAVLHGDADASDRLEKFERTAVFFERNVTDKDAEAIFDVTGASAGLASLKVVAPDGRTVIDFKAADSKLGMRHLEFESPEPRDDLSVKSDFPAGAYTFTGSGTNGSRLEGKAMLSHEFPEATTVLVPKPDASAVPVKSLQIRWESVKGVNAYVVIVENESTGRELRASLAGNVTSFQVPDGFLSPGTEYKLAIGTVALGGNASYVETAFVTAKQ